MEGLAVVLLPVENENKVSPWLTLWESFCRIGLKMLRRAVPQEPKVLKQRRTIRVKFLSLATRVVILGTLKPFKPPGNLFGKVNPLNRKGKGKRPFPKTQKPVSRSDDSDNGGESRWRVNWLLFLKQCLNQGCSDVQVTTSVLGHLHSTDGRLKPKDSKKWKGKGTANGQCGSRMSCRCNRVERLRVVHQTFSWCSFWKRVNKANTIFLNFAPKDEYYEFRALWKALANPGSVSILLTGPAASVTEEGLTTQKAVTRGKFWPQVEHISLLRFENHQMWPWLKTTTQVPKNKIPAVAKCAVRIMASESYRKVFFEKWWFTGSGDRWHCCTNWTSGISADRRLLEPAESREPSPACRALEAERKTRGKASCHERKAGHVYSK